MIRAVIAQFAAEENGFMNENVTGSFPVLREAELTGQSLPRGAFDGLPLKANGSQRLETA
jgi:hypothetical protein